MVPDKGQIFHMDNAGNTVVKQFVWLREKNREGSV